MKISDVLTVLISSAALLVSMRVYFQQTRMQLSANSRAALAKVWEKAGDHEFQEDYRFILQRLAEHPSDKGVSGLPEDVQKRFYRVAYFLQEYAYYVGLDILDLDLTVTVLRDRIINTWNAIEPYVRKQRELYPDSSLYFLLMLENLAEHARSIDPGDAGVLSLVSKVNPKARAGRGLPLKRAARRRSRPTP